MSETSTAIVDELLALSQQLLDAIDRGDWETYDDLCDPSLTAYEPEAVGQLVRGMPCIGFISSRSIVAEPDRASRRSARRTSACWAKLPLSVMSG